MSQTEADRLIQEILGAKAPKPRQTLTERADQAVAELKAVMNAPKVPMIKTTISKILAQITPGYLHDIECRWSEIIQLLQHESDKQKANAVYAALSAVRNLITNAPLGGRRADYSHLNKSKLKALAIELASVMATDGKMHYSRSQGFYLPNFDALLSAKGLIQQNSIRLHNQRIAGRPLIRKF